LDKYYILGFGALRQAFGMLRLTWIQKLKDKIRSMADDHSAESVLLSI
jgi:hypothetical protein